MIFFMGRAKKTYHHGDLRQALVDGAFAALQSTAHEELSLRGISEAIGVSHTAAYRHFPDKHSLLNAVSERGFGQFRDALVAAKGKTGAAYGRQMERMVEAYVEFARQGPNLYRLMFGPGFMERMSAQDTCVAAQESFAVLLDMVREGQEKKALATASPFLLSQTIWAMLHGIALFALDGEVEPAHAAEVARRSWHFLLKGIEVKG